MTYEVVDAVVAGRHGSIPVRDYVPLETPASAASSTRKSAFLWVHGGGFTSGGLDQKESDHPARFLAETGRRVRTIDYRLAPKISVVGKVKLGPASGRFPAAHHDVLDVAAALEDDAGGPVSIGGASAGANIAAGVALARRDAAAGQLRTLILAYGTFHAELPERHDVERDLDGPVVRWAFNPKMTRRMHLNYVGNSALLRPGYAFPGGADLQGLPPTLVVNSRRDRLRASGDTFAEELKAAGVEVKREVINSTHAYLNDPKTDNYQRGMNLITQWLDTHD